MNVKNAQLGMNSSTASNRLVKDILFSYVKDQPCFHCGGLMTRETFSIEHKEPWLYTDDPVKMFFDLENISFSHRVCNTSKARKPTKVYASRNEAKMAWQRANRVYCPERRRRQRERTGK